MSYIKTLWTNKIAPAINAFNLNKMEQGIYDASHKSDNNLTDITKVKLDLSNVQLTPGPIGPSGPTGPTGMGVDFKAVYDTKADMLAHATSPEPGEMHFVKENGGEFWGWSDSVPPHDGTNATWHLMGTHLQGPKGDPGTFANWASNVEIDAGTEHTKPISAYGLKYFRGKYIATASNIEINTGTDNIKIITPKGLAYYMAQHKATHADINSGVNDDKYVTARGLHNSHHIRGSFDPHKNELILTGL